MPSSLPHYHYDGNWYNRMTVYTDTVQPELWYHGGPGDSEPLERGTVPALVSTAFNAYDATVVTLRLQPPVAFHQSRVN
jgi:hypothetical protein